MALEVGDRVIINSPGSAWDRMRAIVVAIDGAVPYPLELGLGDGLVVPFTREEAIKDNSGLVAWAMEFIKDQRSNVAINREGT